MGSNFIPNYGNESDFSSNVQNGNLYVSEDTKRLFFDLNGKRIKVSDVVFLSEKPLIGISGKLYIIKSDNSLWIFEDTWKQLNSSSSGSVNVDNKTINKNSNDQIQSIGVIDSRSGESVKYWTGTLAQYDAIETKDDNTIYNITDDIIDVNQSYFIPADTILTVKTDGSGQFTNLSEAISYLTGKYSNGTVTIQLGEGAFDSLTYTSSSSIPLLIIKGVSQSATTITSVNLTGMGFCQLTDLSVESTSAPAVSVNDYVHFICKRVKMSVPNATSNVVMVVRHLAKADVDTCIFHSDTKGGTGFYLTTGVPIGTYGNCTFENLNTAAYVQYGGILCNKGKNKYTNITNKTNQNLGVSSNNGVIYGKAE